MSRGAGHRQPSCSIHELCNRILLAWACRREGWDKGICLLAPELMSLPDTDIVSMALAQLHGMPEAQRQLREHTHTAYRQHLGREFCADLRAAQQDVCHQKAVRGVATRGAMRGNLLWFPGLPQARRDWPSKG